MFIIKNKNIYLFINSKDSNVNMNSLLNGTPWRHHNPYVYDAAAAVALVGYSPYGPS
jgi:hypothetical protein